MPPDTPAIHPSAREVLQLLAAGGYAAPSGAWVSLRDEQAQAEARTRLYTPEELAALRERARAPDSTPSAAAGAVPGGAASATPGATPGVPRAVEVVAETTQVAACRLSFDGPVAVLNFASARNPGGGFLGGARAQEEELCRCSGLFRALITQPVYYERNRAQRSALYTDHLIYSPDVPFFRVDARAELLERPYLVSVVTAPAPNAGAVRQDHPADMAHLSATFARRWASVLAVAEDNCLRTLLLGAWGCGAFRNDPVVAAETVRDVLASPRFAGAFDRIVFAIPDRGRIGRANLAVFREVLSPRGRDVPEDVVHFYKTSLEWGHFSNFAAWPITIDGTLWPTSEHYFQARKFHDDEYRERIRQARSPLLAVRLGRDRTRGRRADWDAVRVAVMHDALLAKFTQHDELRASLLSTGEARLVEHTKNDAFWGDGGDGSGANMLGRLLMEVRAQLRSEAGCSHPDGVAGGG